MEFIVFLIIVFLVITIIVQNKRNRQTQEQLKELRRRVIDLDEKTIFLYNCLKSNGIVETVKTQTPVQTMPEHQAAPSDESVQPVRTADNLQINSAVETIPKEEERPPLTEPQPQAAVNYFHTVGETTQQNYTPAYAQPPQKPKKNIEEWLGSRLLGAAASVLIFIGLIMFCTLGTDSVTNTMKMAAMFAVSGGAVGAGAFLLRRERSSFPLVLMGCGFGMFFISILISHVYFEVLGELPSFGLILLWTAAAMLLSKKYDSVMLSVTAHLGAAISIVFAYSFAFSQEKAVIISVYELASIGVLMAGNIFCSKKTYRFGLLLSQIIIVFSTIRSNFYFNNNISNKFITPAIIIYLIHIASVSAISYLLADITDSSSDDDNALLFNAIHIINKILWSIVTAAGLVFVMNEIIGANTTISWLTVCAAAGVHLAVTVFLTKKHGFSENLTGITVGVITILISLALYVGTFDGGLPYFSIFALLLVLTHYKTKLKCFAMSAAPVICLDVLYMCIYGYDNIEKIYINIPYLITIITSSILLWFSLGEKKKRMESILKVFIYLTLYISSIKIISPVFGDNSDSLIVCTLSIMNLICCLIKFAPKDQRIVRGFLRAGVMLNIIIGSFIILVETYSDNTVINIIMVVLLLLITAVCSYDLALSEKTFIQIMSAAIPSIVITDCANSFAIYSKNLRFLTVTLSNREILFLFIAILSFVYHKNNNKKLRPVLFISLISEMFSMVFFGYGEALWFKDNVNIIFIPIIIYLILHSVAVLYFCNRMMSTTTEDGEKVTSDTAFYLSYIWALVSIPAITYYCIDKDTLGFAAAASIQLIINIVLHTLISRRMEHAKHGGLDKCALIISACSLYLGMIALTLMNPSNAAQYSVTTLLFLSCTANIIKMAMYLLPLKKTTAEIFVGLSATVLINCTCIGFSNDFDFTYIFSIITMLIALACIVYGFIARAKGMRMYGLAVILICTVKLVTIDIVAADSLARVMAFIIGGVVCFVISGIYSAMEKKIANNKNIIESDGEK